MLLVSQPLLSLLGCAAGWVGYFRLESKAGWSAPRGRESRAWLRPVWTVAPEWRSGEAWSLLGLCLSLDSICVLQQPLLGQRQGHNLNCKPPGSCHPDCHRKPLPYHRAWILHGFLNQGKALKQVGKSLTSPGSFCYRCFSNQRKPWAWVNEGKESL